MFSWHSTSQVQYNDSNINMIHQDYLVLKSDKSIVYQVRWSKVKQEKVLISSKLTFLSSLNMNKQTDKLVDDRQTFTLLPLLPGKYWFYYYLKNIDIFRRWMAPGWVENLNG